MYFSVAEINLSFENFPEIVEFFYDDGDDNDGRLRSANICYVTKLLFSSGLRPQARSEA